MSNFIFKVPELPDSRRNVSNVGSFLAKRDVKDTSRLVLTNGFSREPRSQLQPLREMSEEDFDKPSTSKQCSGIVDRDRPFPTSARNRMLSSLDAVGRQNRNLIGSGSNLNRPSSSFNFAGPEVGMRNRECFRSSKQNPYNSLVNSYNPLQSSYHQMNNPSFGVTGSGMRNTLGVRNGSFRDNLMSTTFNIHNSLVNSFNPLQTSYQMNNKSVNLFNQPQSVGYEPMDDTCSKLSSISNVDSISCFQNESRFQRRNISVSSFMNRMSTRLNFLDSVNNTGQLHSTAIVNETTSEHKIFLQLMMSQMDSTKEQVIKVFEDLTHMLMRNAANQNDELCHFEVRKAAMKIKDIFYNCKESITSKISTTEIKSIMNCTTNTIGPAHKSIMGCEKTMSNDNKKFQDILYNVGVCDRKVEQPECFESFTVRKKKGRNTNKEKVVYEEVNLNNWCPVVSEKGLAFTGTNEENVQCETTTVEKRLNNRRLLLNNGRYCNLIGSPTEDKRFPSRIWQKIKNGIPSNWLQLLKEMVKLKTDPKEVEVATDEVTSTCYTGAKRGQVIKGRQPAERKKSEPASGKTKDSRSGSRSNQRKGADETVVGVDYKVALDQPTPLRGRPKGRKNSITPGKAKDSIADVTIVKTRSGRVVKQPKDIWVGQNFMNETIRARGDKGNVTVLKVDNKTTMLKTKSAEANTTKQVNNDSEPPQLNRKRRVVSEKLAVEAKKMKKEKTTGQEEPKSSLKESKKLGKSKDDKENSAPKSTVNNEAPVDDLGDSPVAAKKKKGKCGRKVEKQTTSTCNKSKVDSPLGDSFAAGLNDIYIPEAMQADTVNLSYRQIELRMETPPIRALRSHLTILKNRTPVQTPDMIHISRHTQSEVKKFEKLRAQTFKQKIPKEGTPAEGRGRDKGKGKKDTSNKGVETVVKWIAQKEVRSPRLRAKFMMNDKGNDDDCDSSICDEDGDLEADD